MRTPIQRLMLVQRNDTGAHSCLIAASGASLWVFNVATGGLLSKWPARHAAADEGRPAKRRKTDDESKEVASRGPASTQALPNRSSFITNLIATSDGRHVAASTAEDKLIYVFELSNDGTLSQLSKRQMVKRPCAIALTPDERSIIVADRFGDVYSLPFMWDEETEKRFREKEAAKPVSSEPWKPAADFSTVHTKGNIQALKNQQNMKMSPGPKEPAMDFEHDFLLGHVSMLTDVIMAQSTTPSGPRQYVITADRDEHIRLSRGPPQSYVIEGFLLGHDELVTQLHIPKWDPGILVSGGGDDYLLMWDWINNKILQRVDIRAPVLENVHDECSGGPPTDWKDDQRLMVSNIWSSTASGQKILLISLEAHPYLLIFRMDDHGTMKFQFCIDASYNVLDAVIWEDDKDGNILYTVDPAYPRSRSKNLDVASRKAPLIWRVVYTCGAVGMVPPSEKYPIMDEDAIEHDGNVDRTKLEEVLYGYEKFRKRRTQDAEGKDAVDAESQIEEE